MGNRPLAVTKGASLSVGTSQLADASPGRAISVATSAVPPATTFRKHALGVLSISLVTVLPPKGFCSVSLFGLSAFADFCPDSAVYRLPNS